MPEISAKQQTEDDAKRVSSITEAAEKMKLTKDENTRAIIAEKQNKHLQALLSENKAADETWPKN